MKILSTQQIREADAYTIENEPIASIDLMERASRAFVNWFSERFSISESRIKIICGLGNNGGDGLAIARMLHPLGYDLEVFVVRYSDKSSADFDINFARLSKQLPIQNIDNQASISFDKNDLVIDAIFGSGLSRPIDGLVKEIVNKVNESNAKVVSVDIPTGLFADSPNTPTDCILEADFTVSFQLPKLAFMLPQNDKFVSEWAVVPIGLSQKFIEDAKTNFYYTNQAQQLIKPRKKFSHKGTFGHGLLIAGSHGMMGAAVLASKAALRSGIGKISIQSAPSGLEIVQISVPEAIFLIDEVAPQNFDAVGVGPGIGVGREIQQNLGKLFTQIAQHNIPIVIDADAINNIAEDRSLERQIPKNAILTPHPKEFKKLVNQDWADDYQKLQILKQYAINQQVTICLKGANTAIALPDGSIHFNSTGNAGMAKAGSGDVLTGMILALLAQGYPPHEAAILGVYEHGHAGDRAVSKRSINSIIASDIIEEIRF